MSTYLPVERCELLINGFVKQEYGKELPSEIVGLCVQFYFVKGDIFDVKRKHEGIELDENTNIVKGKKHKYGTME